MYEFNFEQQDVDLLLKLVREEQERNPNYFDHVLAQLERDLEGGFDS